jgi:tetratricopeptide (TPR) repeat protein
MNDQVMQERNVERLVAILKLTILAVVVGGVAAGAVMFLRSRSEAATEKGFAALFTAEQMEKAAMKEVKDPSAGDAYDVMATWPAERKAAFESSLATVVRDHAGTPAAFAAGLRLGRFHFVVGDLAKAEAALVAVRDGAKSDEYRVYAALAGEALGSVYETRSDFAKAQEAFENAAALADNSLKPLALLGRARSLKALGRKDEAKAVYLKLVEEFPSSAYARQARALLNSPEG